MVACWRMQGEGGGCLHVANYCSAWAISSVPWPAMSCCGLASPRMPHVAASCRRRACIMPALSVCQGFAYPLDPEPKAVAYASLLALSLAGYIFVPTAAILCEKKPKSLTRVGCMVEHVYGRAHTWHVTCRHVSGMACRALVKCFRHAMPCSAVAGHIRYQSLMPTCSSLFLAPGQASALGAPWACGMPHAARAGCWRTGTVACATTVLNSTTAFC